MVSQKRPKGSANHVRMSLARPKDHGVTGAVPKSTKWCRATQPSLHIPANGCPDRRLPSPNLPAIISRTHRMVSPKRPERPRQQPTCPSAWCRRSVPRDRPTHVRMSLARPKDHGVARASRGRQRPPQSLLECAAPGRSSQCGTRN